MKGLQVLKAMGINVTELEPPQTYSNPNLPEKVIEDINNALNMGWKVIVPEDTGELPVIPYIKYDPNSGGAGYMIATAAGGYSGYADRDWPIVDQAVVDFLLGERFYTYWDWEVYSPEDGKTVLLGDIFDAFLRMTIKWISGETEETLVLENVFGTDIPLKIRIVTGPGISENGQPSQWWNPGSYTLSFNRERKFGFNVWGPNIDTDKSDKYLGISTEDGVDRIDTPLKLKYSIREYQGVTITVPRVRISRNGSLVRVIYNIPVGENQEVTWDGKDDGGRIVTPGQYDITISAFGNEKDVETRPHKVTVFKVEVDTNCEILDPPYKCVLDSFIALRYRSGDIVRAKATGITGKLNQSVSWECMGDPNNGIDNGSCNIFPSDIEWFEFIPNPPPAPNGRNRPLAYVVKATLLIDGKSYESKAKIKQDNLDELRQEYEDMPERKSQPRENFDKDPHLPGYPNLLASPGAEPERHQWHILKKYDLNRHAVETKNNYTNLNITSGYRCPRGNALVRGENTSNHQYGKAFDFQQTTHEANYSAYVAAFNAGARVDTYLRGSNGRNYLWNRFYDGNELGPPWPAPQGVTYERGHAAWD